MWMEPCRQQRAIGCAQQTQHVPRLAGPAKRYQLDGGRLTVGGLPLRRRAIPRHPALSAIVTKRASAGWGDVCQASRPCVLEGVYSSTLHCSYVALSARLVGRLVARPSGTQMRAYSLQPGRRQDMPVVRPQCLPTLKHPKPVVRA
jgi:hypothetical protein